LGGFKERGMQGRPKWQWDEVRQAGTDYADAREAENYDARHAKFRDIDAANGDIIARLGLTGADTVLDMGAGTGFFALGAAKHVKKVYAVDVSAAMLDVARRKAKEQGAGNIEFHQAGFLTYEHKGAAVDAAVSVAALHHLPDFWKLVGLMNVASILKDGGRMYLMDVVYSFDPARHAEVFDEEIETSARKVDEEFARQGEGHYGREFSTLDWIMEGLLREAGFAIDDAEYRDGFFASYVCTKKPKA